MKPKRIILLLLIFALLLSFTILFCGCSGNSSPVLSPTQHTYVGSINSDKYHYPTCRCAGNILPENEVCFDSKGEAEKAGYVPCQVCKP